MKKLIQNIDQVFGGSVDTVELDSELLEISPEELVEAVVSSYAESGVADLPLLTGDIEEESIVG